MALVASEQVKRVKVEKIRLENNKYLCKFSRMFASFRKAMSRRSQNPFIGIDGLCRGSEVAFSFVKLIVVFLPSISNKTFSSPKVPTRTKTGAHMFTASGIYALDDIMT